MIKLWASVDSSIIRVAVIVFIFRDKNNLLLSCLFCLVCFMGIFSLGLLAKFDLNINFTKQLLNTENFVIEIYEIR